MRPTQAMRSILAVLALWLIPAWGVQAQGTISFYNHEGTAITNGLTGARVVAGTSFQAALFYAPDAVNVPAEAELLPLPGDPAPIGPVDGIFIGPNLKTPPSTPPGGAAYFQVRAWETAYGATYAQAVAAPPMNGRPALRGVSPIFRVAATGDSVLVPPTTPASLTRNGLQSFTLTYPGLGSSPRLSIIPQNHQATLSWTSADPAFQLEVSTDSSPDSLWTVATNQVMSAGNQRSAVLNLSSGRSFYRLHKP